MLGAHASGQKGAGSSAYRFGHNGGNCPARAAARDAVPWNPDLMHEYAECLVRMLMDRLELAAALVWFGHNGGMCPARAAARDAVPWNPDSMHMQERCVARMPPGRAEPAAADTNGGHNGGMRRCVCYAPNLHCRGSGGRRAHPAGSARGSARSHPGSHVASVSAGHSPLTSTLIMKG
jgi:hypothetical protein